MAAAASLTGMRIAIIKLHRGSIGSCKSVCSRDKTAMEDVGNQKEGEKKVGLDRGGSRGRTWAQARPKSSFVPLSHTHCPVPTVSVRERVIMRPHFPDSLVGRSQTQLAHVMPLTTSLLPDTDQHYFNTWTKDLGSVLSPGLSNKYTAWP